MDMGIAEVIACLHKCFPGVMLCIGEATLYTTMSGQRAVAQLKRDHCRLHTYWDMHPSRAVPLQTSGALLSSPVSMGMFGCLRLALPVRYKWKVVDGTSWLRDVLQEMELQVVRKYVRHL